MHERTFPAGNRLFSPRVGPSLDERRDHALAILARALDYYLTYGGDDAKAAAVHAHGRLKDLDLQIHYRNLAHEDALREADQ